MGKSCSDCGKPATGLFDVGQRPDEYDPTDVTPSVRSQFDRPLCDGCSSSRKRATRTGDVPSSPTAPKKSNST